MTELQALAPLNVRRCNCCMVLRHMDMFHRQKGGWLGRRSWCKSCSKAKDAAAYQCSGAETMRARRATDPSRYAGYTKASHVRNFEKRAARRRELENKRLKQDPLYALNKRISCRLWHQLRGGKAGRRSLDLVGYTAEELRSHIERQFIRGMSWDNAGEWHIDHIVPISAFDVDLESVRRAWALSNSRPLWADDNRRKSAKREFLI